MALVIDDCGADLELARRLIRIDAPLALAVLPFLAHSREVAEAAHRAGRTVMLHLPMEPDGYPRVDPGPGRLLGSMSDAELRAALRLNLESVPHVTGVNNHMGSALTRSRRAMELLAGELAGRGLFFLDSRTSPETVAEEAARAAGVPVCRRAVFLDNSGRPEEIRQALLDLAERCLKEGSLVGIGHARRATVEVLESSLPELRRSGIELVPVETLAR